MDVVFDKSFAKDVEKLNVSAVKNKIKELIIEAEKAENISSLTNVKKLQGFKTYYRVRLGDYRVGIELEKDGTVRFITVLHRRDITRDFRSGHLNQD